MKQLLLSIICFCTYLSANTEEKATKLGNEVFQKIQSEEIDFKEYFLTSKLFKELSEKSPELKEELTDDLLKQYDSMLNQIVKDVERELKDYINNENVVKMRDVVLDELKSKVFDKGGLTIYRYEQKFYRYREVRELKVEFVETSEGLKFFTPPKLRYVATKTNPILKQDVLKQDGDLTEPRKAFNEIYKVLQTKNYSKFYSDYCHQHLRKQVSSDKFILQLEGEMGEMIINLFERVNKELTNSETKMIEKFYKDKTEFGFRLPKDKTKKELWHLELGLEDGKWKLIDID